MVCFFGWLSSLTTSLQFDIVALSWGWRLGSMSQATGRRTGSLDQMMNDLATRFFFGELM
jgi:hypothetical protein